MRTTVSRLKPAMHFPFLRFHKFAQVAAFVTHRRYRFLAFVKMGTALTAVVMIACADESPATPAEYLRLPEFVVGQPTPVLADDGSAERQFVNIRARRLPGGLLAVADIAASAIRIYDGNATMVRTLARGGNGPGELPRAFSIAVRDDTIITFGEPPMSRPDVRVYSATHGYQRLIAATVPGQPAMSVIGQLSDGTYLVKRGARGMVVNDIPKLGIVIADSTSYGVFTPGMKNDSAMVLWFPKIAAGWYYSFPVTSNKIVPVSIDAFPFRARTLVVNSQDVVWEIETGTGELKGFNERGVLRFTKRSSMQPTSFDAKLLAKSSETELQNARSAVDTASITAKFAPGIRPDAAPLFSRAFAGDNGEIWLQRFDLGETSNQNFVIVDRDGVKIGRASIPSGIDLQQIGKDFVLGLRVQPSGTIEIVELQLTRK